MSAPTAPKIIVYGPGQAPFVTKVGMALRVKGLAFELVEPSGPEDFTRWNPETGLLPVLDADGTRVAHSERILDWLDVHHPEPLLVAMISVLKEKYIDKPVTWGSIVRTGPIKTSFLVVAFDTPGGEALKLWEDRSLVKYHKMCDFVRLEAAKGSDVAKKWGVSEFPAFIICDAQEKVLEKVAKKSIDALDLRAAMTKAWKKLEGRR